MDNSEHNPTNYVKPSMRVEQYHRQPIQTVRSFLIRQSKHELSEWPRSLTEDEAELLIHPSYRDRDLTEQQKILYTYLNYLALLNVTGYHIAIEDAFNACMDQCQYKVLSEAIKSEEVTRAFQQNENPSKPSTTR